MRECFVVEGLIPGLFPCPRVFELQVYDGNTLSGIVLNPDEDEEASDAKIQYGTAVQHSDKQDPAGGDDPHEQVYHVKFVLVRAWSPTRGLKGGVKVIPIEGTLSRSFCFHAQWADRGVQTFEIFLSIRRPRSDERVVTSNDHSLSALTPGYYTLKGAAVSASHRFYPTACRVKLRAGGEMEASSTDGDSVTPWEGSWTPTGIQFTLHGYSKKYIYDGKAHSHAIRGEWKAPGVESPSSGEQGTFDFEVVESCRAWSHSSHKHHPKIFRDVVRLCLLSSVQGSEASGESNRATLSLPSDLWSEVFSYCEFDWFSPPSEPKPPAPAIDTPVLNPVSRLLAAYPGLFIALLVKKGASLLQYHSGIRSAKVGGAASTSGNAFPIFVNPQNIANQKPSKSMLECFVVEGRIPGVFSSARIFKLQIYDDGTLSGIVLNPDHDNNASDDELLFGTAVADDEQGYQVNFVLAKGCSRRIGPHLINVEGSLTRGHGLHAQWSDMGNVYQFVLSIRQPRLDERDGVARKLSDDHTLYPLTPGSYTLKGAAISNNGRYTPTTCSLILRASGELEGSLADDGRVSTLEGSWTPDGIQFTLHHWVYVCEGKAHAQAIRGHWKSPYVQSASPTDIRGKFDFAVVETS